MLSKKVKKIVKKKSKFKTKEKILKLKEAKQIV